MSTPTRGLPHNNSETIALYPADSGARAVKLFRNGANQAAQIPKEFELPGTDAALLLALDKIAKPGPCEDNFAYVDEEGVLPLDDIDLGEDLTCRQPPPTCSTFTSSAAS